MAHPRSWYEIRNAASDAAEIYVHDEIGAWGITSKDFTADLRGLRAGTIKLHLNSPGGSVDDGIAIFNALKSHGATVEVYVDALAASIASVIAMAGDRIIMAPHSRMMIHEAMAMGAGFAGDFDKMAARLRDCTENIASIYSERTGKPADHYLALMAEETWFSDKDAVDEGLADEIGRDVSPEAFKIAANFNLSRYRNAPELAVTATAEVDQMGAPGTVAGCLAADVYEAFTECVADFIESSVVTIPEAALITELLSALLSGLDSGLTALGVGDRATPPDDPMDMWDRMARGIERNAGRTMSQKNLDRLHGAMDQLTGIHGGTCDMGDTCPMDSATTNKGHQPASHNEQRRREVDLILASLH